MRGDIKKEHSLKKKKKNSESVEKGMKILAELPGNGKMSTHLTEHHKEFSTKSPGTEGEMTPVASTVNCLPNLYSLVLLIQRE